MKLTNWVFYNIVGPTAARVVCSLIALYVTLSLGLSDDAEFAAGTLGVQAKVLLVSTLMRFGGDVLILKDFSKSSDCAVFKGFVRYALIALVFGGLLTLASTGLRVVGLHSSDHIYMLSSSYLLAVAMVIALLLQAKGHAVLSLCLQFGLQPLLMLVVFKSKSFLGLSTPDAVIFISSTITLGVCLFCIFLLCRESLKQFFAYESQAGSRSIALIAREVPFRSHFEAMLIGLSAAAFLWLPVLFAVEVLNPNSAQDFIVLHRIAFAVSMLRMAAVARLAPEWAKMFLEQDYLSVRLQWRYLTLNLALISFALFLGFLWFIDSLLNFLGLGDPYLVVTFILLSAQCFNLIGGPSSTVLAMAGRLSWVAVCNIFSIIASLFLLIFIGPESPFALAMFFVFPMISMSGVLWFLMCKHFFAELTKSD